MSDPVFLKRFLLLRRWLIAALMRTAGCSTLETASCLRRTRITKSYNRQSTVRRLQPNVLLHRRWGHCHEQHAGIISI